MTVVTAGRKRFFVMANTVAQAASEARYRSDIRYRIVLVPLRTPPARAKHDTPRTKPSLCAFQSGHALMHCTCPLSEGKQTSQLTVPPKRIPPSDGIDVQAFCKLPRLRRSRSAQARPTLFMRYHIESNHALRSFFA